MFEYFILIFADRLGVVLHSLREGPQEQKGKIGNTKKTEKNTHSVDVNNVVVA